MPSIASLDVTFTSVFIGDHRICWAISPSTTYDCSTIIYCPTPGSYTVHIPIIVENDSCSTVTFWGYVQASCESIGSLTGRIAFSSIFTPIPSCASYNVACVNVGVLDLNIVNSGNGYGPNVPPIITIPGGTATATAIVNGQTLVILPGSGFTPGVYTNVNVINILGSGTGALATVTVDGGGSISTPPLITTDGISYLPYDTFSFTGFPGAIFQFGPSYGKVVSTILVPGTGYTSIPTPVVAPQLGLGTLAVLSADLEVCPNQIMGTACDAITVNTITNMTLGQSANKCMTTLPTIGSNYTFTPSGCCYDCKNVTFHNTGSDPVTLYYTDCTTHNIVTITIAGHATTILCCVNNSWYWYPSGAAVAVTVGAVCP